MGHGLQPNAVWYVCVGAILGTVLGTSFIFQQANDLKTELAAFSANAIGLASQPGQAETSALMTNGTTGFELDPIIIETDETPTRIRLSVTVRRGDTLLGLLQQRDISATEAHTIAQSMAGIYDPRDIRVARILT